MDDQWHLSERDFFEGLDQEKQAFLALASQRLLKPNDFVFLENQPGEYVYYLKRGEILILRSSALGKEPIMSIRRPGEMFGLAEVIGRRERKANARAISPSLVYQVAAAHLETLLAGHYPLARRVIEVMGRRVRYLNEQLENLMLLDVSSRVLKALFNLCYPQLAGSEDWDRPVTVPLRLTQEQMAALTGSCQQTISETMKQLQRDGLIQVNGRQVMLCRPLEVMRRLYY